MRIQCNSMEFNVTVFNSIQCNSYNLKIVCQPTEAGKDQELADFKTQVKALTKTIFKLIWLKNKVLCILREETAAQTHSWETNLLTQSGDESR